MWEPRLFHISKLHAAAVITVVIALTAVLIGCATQSRQMYVTNDRSCLSNSGMQFNNCQLCQESDIWFGRVEGMHVDNQNINVVGYIPNLSKPANSVVNYTLTVRGKDKNATVWSDVINVTDSLVLQCEKEDEFCGWFGQVKQLKYSMYDFAVSVDSPEPEARKLQFRIVYVQAAYTNMQLVIRTTYSAIALVVWICYCTKVVCRVPTKEKKQLPSVTWHLLGLSFGLVLFNDPWYAVSILAPSTVSRIFDQLQMTIFVSALMVFWLGQVLNFTEPSNKWCYKFQKSKVLLVTLWSFLFMNFFLFNVIEKYYEDKYPSFSFGHSQDRIRPLMILFIISTVVLLTVFYAIYLVNLICNLKAIHRSSTAMKVILTYSQLVHIIIIAGLLVGIYSRTFANGGAQIFFVGFINLYIYTMLFLYWPVQVLKRSEIQRQETFPKPEKRDVLGNKLDFDNIEMVQLSQGERAAGYEDV